MDQFTHIQTFIKVVKAGSFSAAARHESSISSVARQIKSLEDDLGVRLLNRTTRSLSLTEPGRLFYERACAIAHELSNAKMAVRSFQEGVKGLLRVSLRVSAGAVVVPAMPKFLEQYPELKVDITLTDERSDLVAGNIDVAVWVGSLPDQDIVARRLTPTQRIVCASPGYLARHGTPQVPSDLLRHQCMVFNVPSYGKGWTFRRDDRDEVVEVHGNVCSANGLVLLMAAEANGGLIVVNEWLVRRAIEQARLVRVLSEYQVSPTAGGAELHVVYPSSRGLSRKVRVFVDFLVDLFGAPPT